MERQFDSQEQWKESIEHFVRLHEKDIISYMLEKLGYENLEALSEAERSSPQFLGDCGVVFIIPKNKAMYNEWKKLDNDHRMGCPVAYKSQSVTIKEIQVKYILEHMGIDDTFFDLAYYT